MLRGLQYAQQQVCKQCCCCLSGSSLEFQENWGLECQTNLLLSQQMLESGRQCGTFQEFWSLSIASLFTSYFNFLLFSQFMYVYFILPSRSLKLKNSQPIFGDHSRSDRRWWDLAKACYLKQLLKVLSWPIFPLKRMRHASGRRQEAGFLRMGGSHERRGENARCLLLVFLLLPSGGTSIKSHQEGLSF